MNRYSGFTLIELSIILVIIGLLSAGILVGRDLMQAANMRAQIGQIESLDTAVKTFQMKFNCLPGDCAQAVSLGLGTAGGPGDNGNGDNYLDPTPGVPGVRMYGPEIENFWHHLSNASLIQGSYAGYTGATPPIPGKKSPPLKLQGFGRDISFVTSYFNASGGMWIMPLDPVSPANFPRQRSHIWMMTTTAVQSGTSGVWTGDKLYNMDTKIDDGFPLLGKMRALTGTIHMPADWENITSPGQTCMDNTVTPFIYQIVNSAPTSRSICTALVRAVF